MKSWWIALGMFTALPGCGDSGSGIDDFGQWPLGEVTTTLKTTQQPVSVDPVEEELPIGAESTYLNHDFGLLEPGPGEPHVRRTDLASDASQPQASERRSLLYWIQFSDTHCLDEESPIRVTGLLAEGAWRPQENWTTQLVNQSIRTANGLSGDQPPDFAITTGDITDNGQTNEMEWFITLMDGGWIDPDSGLDDDPIAGPLNDAGDPFWAEGLDRRIPWYAVYGNHEFPLVGTFSLPESEWSHATGSQIRGVDEFVIKGTSRGDAEFPEPITEGPVEPDARREFMGHRRFMELLMESPTLPNGHGFSPENLDRDEGWFSLRPRSALPLRLIGLDSISRPASSDGKIDRIQWDWLADQLTDAWEAGELVIIAQHHPPDTFSDGSEVSTQEYIDTLAAAPHVVAVLNGHTHRNRILAHAAATGGFWEINAPAIIDFPQQFRMGELVDNGDGTLSLFVTLVDHASPEDSPTARARRLSLAHFRLLGDALPNRIGLDGQRNVELIWPLPGGWTLHDWPARDRIESLTTLTDP